MPERPNDAWTSAWSKRYDAGGGDAAGPRKRARRVGLGGRTKGTHVLLASVLMAMLITPFAVAQSGGGSGGGVARVTNDDDRYAFLARNTRQGDGGAGALACRSDANAAGETHREPCLNMVNTGTGYAAAFRTRGLTGFRLQTSGQGQATPFLLDSNATGKVEHLNADAVDGLSSEQMRARFARVNVTGTNATLADGPNGVTGVNRISEGRYRVTFDASVANCAFSATSTQLGQARILSANPVDGEAQNVDVQVRNQNNNTVDGGFSISANC